MTSRSESKQWAGHAQERINASISGIGTGSCQACLKILPPGSGSHYCSSRCRLRGWAVRELTKALHEGMAEGLRGEILDLGRKASVRHQADIKRRK